MPYSPNEMLDLKVEIEIDGVWTTVTSRSRSAGGVRIKHGRSDGAIQGETSTLEVTVGNDDGWLTEENPFSPWYGFIGRGTPIRFSLVGILPADAQRFEGEIDEMFAVYPGGSSSSMRITAIGKLGVAAQNDDPLQTAMYRSMIGVTEGDYIPHAYWPLEDGADATTFANVSAGGLPGVPVVSEGDNVVQFAADSSIVGSAPLPLLTDGTGIEFTIPPYTDTGFWALQFASSQLNMDTNPSVIVRVGSTDIVVQWALGFDELNTFAFGPGLVFENVDSFTGANYLNQPLSLLLASVDTGGGDVFVARLIDSDGNTVAETIDTNPGVYGLPVTATIRVPTGLGDQLLVPGHVTLFTDPAFDHLTDGVEGARAMSGWDGEQAHERIERLGREERLAVVIVGSESAAMGPQRVDTFHGLIKACEQADQGLLGDSGAGGAITYRTVRDLYNQTAQVAITYGSLTPDFAPIWDNQRVSNDWTVTRPGGSSGRVSDEAHVTSKRRRIKRTLTANVETDAALTNLAGWLVAIGTTPGPRYAAGGINLRNSGGAKLADAVLGVVTGDRFTAAATALPSQHPPGGFDQLILGWQEYIDVDEWLFFPNMVPSKPYIDVGVWGSNPAGTRFGARNTVLAEDLTAVETAADVTATGEVWITTASHPSRFPFDVTIGGLVYSCTAITGTTPNYTLTLSRLATDKTHTAGDPVTVTDTGRYGL